MTIRFAVAGVIAAVTLAGAAPAFADTTIATPGTTSPCIGVTPGTTTVSSSGQISHSGSAFYFNGVSCLI